MSIETMTKLSTITVGVGGAASIDFTNIPQNYTDLLIKVSSRATTTNNEFDLTFNGISTGYIGSKVLYSTGSAAGSYTGGTTFIDGSNTEPSNYTASIFASADIYISQYSGYNPKVVSIESVQENNATASLNQIGAGMLNNPLPITRITLTRAFDQHSTATLYGIKNARATAGNSVKATGGAISFDGTYVIHTFNSTGTFTPLTSLDIDYLVVGGGASGGAGNGGGGGAGGYRTNCGTSGRNSTSEAKKTVSGGLGYSIVVGAGGASKTWSGAGLVGQGNPGSSSIFDNITSLGGGGGGNFDNSTVGGAGAGGGSGGGGGGGDSTTNPGGAGTSAQGFDGGTGSLQSTTNTGGGGGGAGANGENAPTNRGGNGGSGIASVISGSSVFMAGGGGGGARANEVGGAGGAGGGGSGGGTASTDGSNGNPGFANTGGGGGGAGNGLTSGSGASGVVIIRYKAQ